MPISTGNERNENERPTCKCKCRPPIRAPVSKDAPARVISSGRYISATTSSHIVHSSFTSSALQSHRSNPSSHDEQQVPPGQPSWCWPPCAVWPPPSTASVEASDEATEEASAVDSEATGVTAEASEEDLAVDSEAMGATAAVSMAEPVT
ncbi:hypothetical protein V5799_022472 [Amblyomma americanum]|uniref:Uncharacterized protein n=1 Tax=Amblyomma americanum TaxID=6943 RepID=A0AAQ4FMF4_AMBAM